MAALVFGLYQNSSAEKIIDDPIVKHTPLARSRSQNQVGPKTKYMGILFNETYSQRDLLHMATKSRGSIGSANPYDSEVLLSKNLIGIGTK